MTDGGPRAGASALARLWTAARPRLLAPLVAGALSLAAQVSPTPAQAQDDWEISRDPEPGPRAPRGPARPRAPGAGTSRADVEARMVERYLGIVLARPEDEGAVRRLLERAASRPGGVEGLVADVRARVGELGAAGELALAALAVARGDDAEGRASIARALGREPGSVTARVLRARLELRAGDRSAAAATIAEAEGLERDAARREALARERALLLLELGRLDEARAIFARLARGGSVLARTELVRALVARGRCADALADFPEAERAAAADASASVGLALLRARCETELGTPDAARATLAGAWPRALRSGRAVEVLDAMVELARATDGLAALVDALAALGPRASLHRGVALEELGRDDEALAAFEAVLAAQPRDAETRQRTIRLLSRNGRIEEALDAQRALARLFPDRIALTLELARALRDQGRDAESLAVLDRARARARRDRTALFLLVDAYARWGERDRVLATLEALVRASPEDPRALTALANELLERGERERALELLDRVARAGAGGIEGELEAARALANLRIFDRALAHLEAAARARPDAPEVLEAQAEVLERAGRDDDAERALARRIALGATSPEAEQAVLDAEARLVASWARRGRLQAHRAELARGHAQGDAGASRMLADLQRRTGDLAGALVTLEALAARRPDDARLLTTIARLQHERGDYDAEVAALRRLAELEPARAGWHYTRLVELALAAYRDEDAIAFAEEAARRSVDDAGIELRLGRLHARRRDPARAAAAYARALAIDPDAFEAAWELASLEREAGRGRRAVELYLDILGRTRDDELRERSGRAALETARAEGLEASLEPRLLSLALSNGDTPVFRRLALALYASLSGAARARGEEGELSRWVGRALPVLLASLRDPDLGARAGARQLLFAHPVRGASAALLALAADEDVEPTVRVEALAAAIRVLAPSDRGALLELVGGPSEPLATLALHGLARLVAPPERARLLRELRAAEGPLGEHAWAWTLLAGGREVPSAPPAGPPWLLVWHAARAGEPAAIRAALAAQVAAPRGRQDVSLEVAVELAASGQVGDVELDELALRALTIREADASRALRMLVARARPDPSCAVAIAPSEGLDAWVLRTLQACPREARDPAAVARSLERAAAAVDEASLPRALDRVTALASRDEPGRELCGPAARVLAARLLPSARAQVEAAGAVARAATVMPDLLSDHELAQLLAHPDARARALAVAAAPLPGASSSLLALARAEPSWVVRRAVLVRLADPRAAPDVALEGVRLGLADSVSYVRSAAIELALASSAPGRCALLEARAGVEADPVVSARLREGLAACAGPPR